MTIAINENKTYGVLHSENYFSFFGFSKKINSEKIQKIDVFLDNQLIDTIIANETVEKIEDIYEIQNFSFKYDLAQKYIGKKHTISFKNHSTQENLQNSPYTLIDNENPKFNEYTFLHSLVTINPDEIKDIYCPNSIGFIFTKNYANDDEFISYINYLCNNFNYDVIVFYFEEIILEKNKNIFSKKIKFKLIQNLSDIRENIEIFIWGYSERNFSNKVINKLINKNIFQICFNPLLKNKTLEKSYNENPHLNFLHENLYLLNLDLNKISKYDNNIYIYINEFAKKFISFNTWEKITPQTNAFYVFNIIFLKYMIESKEFKNFYFEFYMNLRSLFHKKKF